MRGFYRMDYRGVADDGWGALAFVDGKVAGLDAGGGLYNGHYVDNGKDVSGEVTMMFPNGGSLVTGVAIPKGAPPQKIPFVIESKSAKQTFALNTPTGVVHVKLTKTSDL